MAKLMSAWGTAHPEATQEDCAAARRETQIAVALGVCGTTRRRERCWFAAKRELLMSQAAARNSARTQ